MLSVTRPKNMTHRVVNRNWAATAVSAMQGALVTPLIALTDVKNAAGDGESGISMIKGMLGV
jgi:hypothetical protein